MTGAPALNIKSGTSNIEVCPGMAATTLSTWAEDKWGAENWQPDTGYVHRGKKRADFIRISPPIRLTHRSGASKMINRSLCVENWGIADGEKYWEYRQKSSIYFLVSTEKVRNRDFHIRPYQEYGGGSQRWIWAVGGCPAVGRSQVRRSCQVWNPPECQEWLHLRRGLYQF